MNSHLSSSYTLLYHLFCHNLQNGDHVVLRFIFLLTSIQVDFFCDRFCKHFCRPTASLMAASSHATKLLRNSSRNMTMSHKSIIPSFKQLNSIEHLWDTPEPHQNLQDPKIHHAKHHRTPQMSHIHTLMHQSCLPG